MKINGVLRKQSERFENEEVEQQKRVIALRAYIIKK